MQSEVKLSTLLHFSLGNPEPGAVNFNFLHALLAAILQHLDISNLNVSTDGLLPKSPVEVEPTTEMAEAAITNEIGISLQSVAPSVYQSLENRLAKVEKQLTNLDSLPENADLLDFVFSGQPKAELAEKDKRKMTELWQTVQTKRRLDSLEGGLEKVCGVMDDLLISMRELESSHAKLQEALKGLELQGDTLDSFKLFGEQITKLSSVQAKILARLREAVSVDALKGVITWNSLKATISNTEPTESPGQPGQKPPDGEVPELVSSLPYSMTKCDDDSLKAWLSQICGLQSNLDEIHKRILQLEEGIKNAATLDDLSQIKVPDDIFKDIEELQAQVKRLLEEKQKVLIERGSDPVDVHDPMFPHLLPLSAGSPSGPQRRSSSPSLKAAILTADEPAAGETSPTNLLRQPRPTAESTNLSSETTRTAETLHALEPLPHREPSAPERGTGRTQMSEWGKRWHDRLYHIEDRLEQLKTLTNGLGERIGYLRSGLEDIRGGLSEQRHKIEVLNAELEDLDQQKASMTYVDDALRKKLDKSDLDSKLDRALFDQTTDGLRRIVEGLLEKLLAVENELRGMIDGLSGNILSKAEKDELEELRKWLEKKLASLPTRTKRASKKPQVDDCCQHLGHAHGDGAAGFRRQIVSHFHCISCDRPLELEIEKVDVPTLPELRSFRQGRSPRPLALTDLAKGRGRRRLRDLRSFYLDPPYVDLGTSFYDAYRSPRQCGGEHTTTSPESRLRRAQMALGMAYDEDELDDIPGYAAIENGAASPDRLRKSTISLPPLDKVRPQSAGGMGHATMSGRQDPVDGKTKRLRLVALTQENELQDFPTAPEPSAIYEGESEEEWDDRVKQQSVEVRDRKAVTPTPRSTATIRRSLDVSCANDVKLLDVETPQVLKEQEDPENSKHISEDHPVDPGEEKDP